MTSSTQHRQEQPDLLKEGIDDLFVVDAEGKRCSVGDLRNTKEQQGGGQG
jgi:hypothetical protein